MDVICRFCLKVPNEEMRKLEEHNLLFKIQSCLSIQTSRHELLPNQLCIKCANKVDEIHEFHTKINESERKLQDCLLNDSLQDYYLKLTGNSTIKKEKPESMVFCESKDVKNEDSNIIISSIDRNVNKNENNDFSQLDNLKSEGLGVDDFNEPCNTSEDEITLSNIKKEKEINSNIHSKTSKQIKKIKLTKRSKKSNTLKDSLNTTTLNMDLVKSIICLTCLKVCDTQTDLIKHYNDEHFNKYKNTMKLKYTENVFDGNVTYKCDSCEKVYDLRKDIIKHVSTHNEERPLICKLCGRMYKTVSEIIRHGRVHSGLKLQCSYNCGYSTAYGGALKEHENRHRDMYKYTCDKCGKGFHVRTWYEQHQNVHNGLKPFVCDICGLAFHMTRYLTAHRSLMHPQSSSVKRYICIHCNHKCDSANSLALHLEEHGINKVKDFLCDFCGKILASADQLKYHHRMHSGEKPYSCSICSKSFAKKFNVKVHMSSHTGEKTHACARCGKRYSQRSTMLRHLKRHHTGSSPKGTGLQEHKIKIH